MNVITIFNFNVTNLRSDETPVRIGEYSLKTYVHGVFARVETEFTLHNDNARVFEGELEFPLPDGGVICGYAIDINGVMTPGSVVEKEKARIAFDAEIKLGIDPGLVEQVRGNAYRTRIYPILAHGSRRVRIEYVMPLNVDSCGTASIFLPMPSEKLAKRDVEIDVEVPDAVTPEITGLDDHRFTRPETFWHVECHETDIKPNDDLTVILPKLPEILTNLEINDGDTYFAASVLTKPAESQRELPTQWRIFWDASSSRKPDDIKLAREVVEILPETAKYELHIFRNKPEDVLTFSSRIMLLEAIDAIPYDGATDYASIAPETAKKFDGMTLFFSDGLDTVTCEVPEIGENALALVSGNAKDTATLRRICGHVLDLKQHSPQAVIEYITNPPAIVTGVRGANITNIQGIGMPATGRVTVLGRLKSATSHAEIVLSNGQVFPVLLEKNKPRTGNTLAAAWAAKRIAELSPNAEANREELLAIGKHFSIVSPVSSLIVFETLDQWIRYDIEPPISLQSLHDEWLKKRKSAQNAKYRDAQKWKSRLDALWENRLQWWKSPMPKIQKPSSGLFTNNATNSLSSNLSSESTQTGLFQNISNRVRNLMHSVVPTAHSEPISSTEQEDNSTDEDFDDSCMIYSCCTTDPRQRNDLIEILGKHDGEETRCNPLTSRPSAGSITIQAWNPDTPYLEKIKNTRQVFGDDEAMYSEYLKQRSQYATCPAFYLDCAGLFFKENKKELAIRILSNLSELKIDDVSLLRVYAWRLREAGELDTAIIILRKVAKLRGDEAVSWRDLALTLTMRAKQKLSKEDVEEALELFKLAAFSPRNRDDAIYTAIVALEEFNELAHWCDLQSWPEGAPQIPEIDEKYRKLMALDLRIALMWDADNTDIDLHVLEPSGEEVFYGNRRSISGAMLSDDVTTGYGPEEYLHRKAMPGIYQIMSNYYASHQQKLTGNGTVTATVFTDWGRENQQSQTMSLRLEQAKDNVKIGQIEVK